MKPRYLVLVGSHLAVLGLVYGIARGGTGSERDSDGPRTAAKAWDRSASPPAGDGEILLADFMQRKKESQAISIYESLKSTLPVAADPKAAAVKAIEGFAAAAGSDKHDGEESERRLAEVAVRVLHWMRHSGDPGTVMDYLWTDAGAGGMNLVSLLSSTAIRDMAAEQGIMKSAPWLWKTLYTRDTFGRVALEEMKAGGGFGLITRLEAALQDDPMFSSQRRFAVSNPSGKMESYYLQVGAATRFDEGQALFDFALSHRHQEVREDLLRGFARSSEKAARWLLDQEGLDPNLADLLRRDRNLLASRDTGLSYDARVEAAEQAGGQEGKDRQAILNDLVYQDLNRTLHEGRDWRYDFRHGVASLDEVLAAVRTAMPAVPPEGEEALVVSLYRNLVEENAKRALPLLDALPEDRRREALFHSTWLSMVNIDPDDYLDFFSALPEPVTASEKDLRTKGWNWKARGFLMRYGDDYVEWVKEMPPGIDKDTAMNSLIWATREQNPAEARKLNEQLYPPKANEEE